MALLKTLVFDFDGTLCDSYQAAIVTMNFLSDEFGYRKIRPDEHLTLRDKSVRELLKTFGIPLVKLPHLVRRAQIELHHKMESIPLVAGMPETLSELRKRGYELGILTSNSEENVKKFIQKNQLLGLFNFIFAGSSIFGKSKTLKNLLKKQKLLPEEVIYIGDETRDIEAAKQSKIPIVSVSWGFNSKSALQSYHPNYLVDQPEEFLQIFKQRPC